KKIVKEVTGNENTTFREWHEFKEKNPQLNLKDIYVEACNLNTKLNETFSHQSQHADVPIADAIRASMGFPVFFSPWKIKNCLYGDGGEQNNCPSDVFEVKPGKPNPDVLSVRLDSLEEIRYFKYGVLPSPVPIKNALECTFAHLESCLNAQNRAFYQSPYCKQTIFCDTLEVSTLDFELKEDTKVALEASGYYGTMRFMHKHHPEITDKRCDKQTLQKLQETDFPISFTEFLSNHAVKEDTPEVVKPSRRKNQPVTPLFHHWKGLCVMQQKCSEFKDIDYRTMPKATARTFRKSSLSR
ncbi:MAG: patatin-like phospholipase family protein, partial [Candidatus Berkiella sp.]